MQPDKREIDRRELNAKKNIEKHGDIINTLSRVLWSDRTSEYQKKIANEAYQELTMGTRMGGLTLSESRVVNHAVRAMESPLLIYVGRVGNSYKGIPVIYEGGPIFRVKGEDRRLSNFRVTSGELFGGVLVANMSREGFHKPKGANNYKPLRQGSPYVLEIIVKEHKEYEGRKQTFIRIIDISD